MLTFTVYGVAQPKGNMRAFIKRGMKFPIVTDSNRNAKSWAQLVAEGASRELAGRTIARLQEGALRVSAEFSLPRPKKYQRRGVAVAHLTAPDLDKLLRSVLDAMSEVVYLDDAQIVEVVAAKRYADVDEPPHVTITVEPTSPAQPYAAPPVPLPLFSRETSHEAV
jgi:Holliday junction resolvase RusA-like endonuclease